jgi:polyketide synthase 12/myxalamid-type polyketide synthase MxaB
MTRTCLVEGLQASIDEHGDWPAYTFLEAGDWDGPRTSRTAVELDAAARRIAGALQGAGLAHRPAVLLYPPGMAFVEAFYACLYVGVIAVPAWPPDVSRLSRTLPRLVAMAADAGTVAVLTTTEIAGLAAHLGELAPSLAALPWIATDALVDPPAFVDRGRGDIAFLQYTSGSTGAPKGVVVTHDSLAANLTAIVEACRLVPGDTVVSWLPQYHDMGLIGNMLAPVHARGGAVMLSPVDFLRRPFRWAEALSRAAATATGAPDFGWALLARKITDAEVATLDLSRLRMAYSGAEPVRPETVSAVERRLAPAGFRPSMWMPMYGLAESTLMVTGGVPAGGAPIVHGVDPRALAAGTARPGNHKLVGCGLPVRGLRVRVVEQGRALPDGVVGEIAISGSSVAAGYWNKPELSREIFGLRVEGEDGSFLATGDLGFLHEGELFVTGRRKDLLIVRGRNLYPQDLEDSAVAAHAAVRRGCVAAFGYERDGEEVVGLAAEIDPARATDGPDGVVAAIRAALAEQHDVVIDLVLLLEPRGLPKTSSGKVQRGATRDAWRDGTLPVLHQAKDATAAARSADAASGGAADLVLRKLTRVVATWTGRPEAAIDPDAPLRSLGLDSLRLVEMANAAEHASGVRVEMADVYNHPTLRALAGHVRSRATHANGTVVEARPGGAAGGDELEASAEPRSRWGAPPNPRLGRSLRAAGNPRRASEADYPGLNEGRVRIDARSTDYQYDIERDIPWGAFDEPGLYVRPAVLAGLGFDVDVLLADREAMALAQWAMALAVCVVFEWLEIGVIRFIENGHAQMGSARCLDLFVEEEWKHIATFRRFRERLEAARPGDVPAFWAAIEPTLEILRRLDPDPVASTRALNPSLSLLDAHYLSWLHATVFEGYTIWYHEALDGASDPAQPVQPLWLRIHDLHRQEEVQHLGTDSVHLRHIAVSAERKEVLSAAFCATLTRDFDHLFGVDAVVRVVRDRRKCDIRSSDPFRVARALQAVLAIPALATLRREAPFVETALSLPPDRVLSEALRAARQAEAPALERGAAEAHEAIAIVGIGCRYPGGARDPEAFFQQLLAGADAIREVPRARWEIDAWYDRDPDAIGKMNTRWGGFIDGVEDFDPLFFGVAPREARAMDPQQRVLLEVTWEALEDAGIPPSSLLGTPAGVFIGIASWDYSRRQISEPLGPWSTTGVALSIASGRISYLLGLTGPCLSVDTACSSSLVAMDLAVKSLRTGEASLAIVGGVQLLLHAETTVGFTRLRAMSPTGRCRSFDADADGYVRSDGCGVVVLKRLADARRDRDRIYAVVRGTAVNQDGRSQGLTAPNGTAQQAVMRAALADARIEAAELGYVEAHGTGTPLGDPIEIGAIGEVVKGRKEPIWVGSVKSAIGHSEAASGLAGLIKAALAVRHGIIPPNLHFRSPNPRVPWADLPVRIPPHAVCWPAGPRFAGVSSFGFGGTNAHVVLGEAPPEGAQAAERASCVRFLALSAPDDAGLAASAARLRDHLAAHPEADLDDVAHTALVGRNAFPRRAAVVAPDREAALAGLAALALGKPGDAGPDTAREGLRVGFLFTGQGAQYAGMGAVLAEACPVFRDALERAAAVLGPSLGRSLHSLLHDASAIHETGVTQPAMVAIALALAETWKSFGVEPALLLGHSVGEIAAAAVAGVFDLPVALKLIEARARLMQALPKGGAMVAVEVDEPTALTALGAEADRVSVAVINAANQVVISGEAGGVQAVVARLEARAGRSISRRLQVSHAFHSPLMEPMLDDFESALRGLEMKRPRLPLVSNVTGGLAGAEIARPGYWSMHVRAPVRFAAGLRTAVESGIAAFVELGPHPTLLALAAQAYPSLVLLPSLRRGQDDRAVLARSVASLWAAGGHIDGGAVLPGRRVALPTWPFARQRYWLEAAPAGAAQGERVGHPLLGRRLDVAGPAIFETTLSREAAGLLAEHLVGGEPVLPAAAWVELARAAAAEATGSEVTIEDLRIEDALRWPEPVRLQTRVEGDLVTIAARRPEGWHVHANAKARRAPPVDHDAVALEGVAALEPIAVDYAAFEAAGLGYGPAFQGLRALRAGEGVAIGEIAVPDVVRAEKGYGLHPAVLDAAFQACSALLGDVGLALPIAIGRLTLYARPQAEALVVLVRTASGTSPAATERRFDLDVVERDGRRVARVEGLTLRVVRPARAPRTAEALMTAWEALPRVAVRPAATRRRVLGTTALADAVTKALPGEVVTGAGPVDEVLFLAEGRTLAEGLEVLLDASCTQLGPAERLVVATTGAFALGGEARVEGSPPQPDAMRPIDPADMAAQRGIWCFARSIALERPGRVRLIDLDPNASDLAARAAFLVEECGATDAEDQVARRGSLRFGARLVPLEPAVLVPPVEGGFRLGAAARGSIDNLALTSVDEPSPGPGEVRIAVEAAGLNFRDVLNVLGMYPGDPGPLGGECTGTIEAVGPGVTGLCVGDSVVAIVPGAFARNVVIDARLCAPRPKGWTAGEAATLPIAFATAWHALYDLADLRAGQVALIHAAAGGVGLAAIQLARRVGARVLGTASAGKQAVVLAQGAEKVASSREPGFSTTFATPVDVVLNSLTGPFIPESLRALRPGGVFLEMGKIEIWSQAQVEEVRAGVAYRPFDLAALPIEDLHRLLRAAVGAADRGEIQPLVHTCFPIARSKDAFRYMAAARHVGKVVISARPLPANGSWVITGGTGAVGGAVARWLVGLGVRRLVLVARRADGEATTALVAALREAGADVTAVAADVSRSEDLERLAAVAGDVRGIVHAAGVLDDALVQDLTRARIRAVLAPKAEAAARLAARWPDADFIATSSIAAALGSPGQAAYAAANGALDGLITALAARGRTARSIQYGPWAGAGMAAATRARHAVQGLVPVDPADAARWLGLSLAADVPVLSVAVLDRKRLSTRLEGQVPALLSGLGLGPVAPARKSLAAEIEAATPSERRGVVIQWLRHAVAHVVGAAPEAIDVRRPLRDFGLDSLMAVELQGKLGSALGRDLPRTLLVDHPTLDSLAGFLVAEPQVAAGARVDAPAPVAAPAAAALFAPEPAAGDEVGAALAALEALL